MHFIFFIIMFIINYFVSKEKYSNIEEENDILEYNNYYLNLNYEKLNPNKYILINEQLDFESNKNVLDPYLLSIVLSNIINKEIINTNNITDLSYNIKDDYNKFIEDLDNINITLNDNISNYFKLYLDEDNGESFNCNNIDICELTIYDYYIYSINYDDENKIEYDIQYIFRIQNSDYMYVYRFLINRYTDNFIIHNIELEGITIETNNTYDYSYDKKLWTDTNKYDINIEDGYNSYNDLYDYQMNSDYLFNLENIEIIESFDNEDDIEENEFEIQYQCFNSYGETQDECENTYDNYGNEKELGVWDKLCENNEDCPFYKANENYDNEFGGCVDGYCELPLNMESISPHYYKEDSKKQPYCHNYQYEYDSCFLQTNKELYPDLLSPDYAFQKDGR